MEEIEQYDVVIITYSLTMIPDWETAVTKIYHSLRPAWYLAIADLSREWMVVKRGGFPLCPSFLTCPYYVGLYRK